MSGSRGQWLCSIGLLAGLVGCAPTDSPRGDGSGKLPTLDQSKLEAKSSDDSYLELRPNECHVRACTASGAGTFLVDQEKSQGENSWFARLRSPSITLYRKLVDLAADDARNRSVGEALETYYQLAEAEGRTDLLLLSQTEVDEQLSLLEELVKHRIRPRSELDAARRQQGHLKTDEETGRRTIERLNTRLKELLGFPASMDHRLWPVVKLSVPQQQINAAAEVKTGLAQRSDLQLIRQVLNEPNSSSLASIRVGLSNLHVRLTRSPMPPSPMAPLVGSMLDRLAGSDEAHWRAELEALLHEREEQATVEIRQAVQELDDHHREIEKDQAAISAKQVAELDETQPNGKGDIDLSCARLDQIKVRTDLLHHVIAWEIAQVHLRQAQGLLVSDCKDGGNCCASGER